jgi:hypothetical protein
MEDEMRKPAFVEMAEKDMDFEAEWVIKGLCKYAEKNCIECDFILETFLKAFRQKVKVESEDKE